MKFTLKLGGKRDKTFDDCKSHITRLLNVYDENIEINKLSENNIVDYFRKQYIDLNRCAASLNIGICSISFLYSLCFNLSGISGIFPMQKDRLK